MASPGYREGVHAWLQRMALGLHREEHTLCLATEKGLVPDHIRVPGYREGARAWLQRSASRMTTETLYLATEKGLTPSYREGSRALLQRRASRLITETLCLVSL